MTRCSKITLLELTVCISLVAQSDGAEPPKLSGSYMLQNKATGLMLPVSYTHLRAHET